MKIFHLLKTLIPTSLFMHILTSDDCKTAVNTGLKALMFREALGLSFRGLWQFANMPAQ